MSQSYYHKKQYEKAALENFNNLSILNSINSMIENNSNAKNDIFEVSKGLSEEYIPIRDLLAGDVSYGLKDYSSASHFYELANNDKVLFLQKGVQNRLVYLSFKK